MMKLNDKADVLAFLAAVDQCEGDVVIRRETEQSVEEYNLKSLISGIRGAARLLEENAESYELFCMNKKDEPALLKYFHEKYQHEQEDQVQANEEA